MKTSTADMIPTFPTPRADPPLQLEITEALRIVRRIKIDADCDDYGLDMAAGHLSHAFQETALQRLPYLSLPDQAEVIRMIHDRMPQDAGAKGPRYQQCLLRMVVPNDYLRRIEPAGVVA